MDFFLYINEKYAENPQKNFECFPFFWRSPQESYKLVLSRAWELFFNVQICKKIKSIFVSLQEKLKVLFCTPDMLSRHTSASRHTGYGALVYLSIILLDWSTWVLD